MSVHKSLKLKGSLKRVRNVLTRTERIELMQEPRHVEKGALDLRPAEDARGHVAPSEAASHALQVRMADSR